MIDVREKVGYWLGSLKYRKKYFNKLNVKHENESLSNLPLHRRRRHWHERVGGALGAARLQGERLGPGGRAYHPAPGGPGGRNSPGPPRRTPGRGRYRGPHHRGQGGQPGTDRGPGPGLTVLRRGQMLARLMEGHQQIAITGAHGKTSTTAMTAAILRAGGLDPTVVVGAIWDNLGSNAVLGRGDYFVAESDESDGSFTYLRPQTTVVTNLDREHLDYYRDLPHIQETFAAYFLKLPAGSRVIAWADDPHLKPVLRHHTGELITYSLKTGADFRATELGPLGLGYRFRLVYRGRDLGTLQVPLAGTTTCSTPWPPAPWRTALGLDFSAWQAGPEGPGPDSPALPGQGRGPGRAGAGRLRPSPHRDRLHPGGPGPGLPAAPPGGGLPAAPLQPHPGLIAGILPGLCPGRAGVHHRDLRRQRVPSERGLGPVRL